MPDEADEVGDEAHLAGLQQQPAQRAARAARRRVVEEQPHPHRAAAAAARLHLGAATGRREGRRATAPRAGQKRCGRRASLGPSPGGGAGSGARDGAAAGAGGCWRDEAAARRDRAVAAAAGGRYGQSGGTEPEGAGVAACPVPQLPGRAWVEQRVFSEPCRGRAEGGSRAAAPAGAGRARGGPVRGCRRVSGGGCRDFASRRLPPG